MSLKKTVPVVFLTLLLALAFIGSAHAAPDRMTLTGHLPPAVARLNPKGLLPVTNNIYLAIGLPLRNQSALDELINQLYDPASAHFHKFLTPEEFTARFGPTEADYQAVIKFAQANGLSVVGKHPNRVVLDVAGSVSNIEQAFKVTLRLYKHPTESRDFFAPDIEPSVPADLLVADMWGLSDYALPRPLSRKVDPLKIAPLNSNGSGPGGAYLGIDFRNAYAPGTALTGTGQIAAVVEFDGYYASDIANYVAQAGYAAVPLQNVLINGVSGTPGYSGVANAVAEVSLDIELLIAMAPGLSKVVVYEGNSPYDVFNRVVTDNSARQISCSWAWSTGPSHNWGHPGTKTLDSQLQQMIAQGQSFFQASGDSDAYTGAQALNSSTGPIPVDSIYVTSVGGTSLTMNGVGTSWSSETVWNWGNNTGTGGGISPNYAIPSWQANVSMAANGGSAVNRNVPDVALTADAVYVLYNNGNAGAFGGTSCAAPLWAGFCALVNQQAVASGGSANAVGFLNPALYAIASSTNYSACFHDIVTGNNIGNNTPGLFNAVAGYDLCTGLGTPNGNNLINALAPPTLPFFATQPSGQIVTNGTSVILSATVSGKAPLFYKWLLNGTNLIAGGNISGTASNVLSITSATTVNSGNYNLVASNSYGSVTSSVAALTVGSPPVFSAQPASVTILSGSNALFGVTVGGSAPLAYQWRKNGTNLVNGGGISGATTNTLILTTVTTNSSGTYTLAVTNLFGTAISSPAALSVVLPPTITTGSLTNRDIECGSNVAYTVTASGAPPLSFQWSMDGTPIVGATSASLSLTNVHLPNHNVTLVVTNPYTSLVSNVVLAVHDTLAPVITLNGANPINLELGGAFTDPGGSAVDICAGSLAVSAVGNVNTNAVGTNVITYVASDGNGNTNTATRTIIVRDTTPPAIVGSFTNLILAADTNCSAPMPDVTGTNFIRASDLSGILTILQSPANTAILPLGTNAVVITVKDASGNAVFSTNTIVVRDQTPPMILSQPASQTNLVGTVANFQVNATACTPLAYQWFFNNAALTTETANSLSLSNVAASASGNYYVVATATGGASTSMVATLTVNPRPSALVLNSSANLSGYRDNLNFTAVVTPINATGSIEFFTNGTAFDSQTLSGGQTVSADLSSLPRGSNLIVAVYSGDVNDLPATNSLVQIVTNHPPMAVSAFYNRTAGNVLNIAIADLATNWTDLDGDLSSLAYLTVSTNGVTVTNNAGTLAYFNPNDVSDQFTCAISDGWGGTNFQAVTIGVVFPVNPTPKITGATGNSDGSFTLNFIGAPNYTYVLETATNLVSPADWLPVSTNTLGTNGVWQFNDAQAVNFQRRFYRLKLVP